MILPPRQAQERVEQARASLRAAERDRDASFAAWCEDDAEANGTHGTITRLAAEVDRSDRFESVRQAVKRGRRAARTT